MYTLIYRCNNRQLHPNLMFNSESAILTTDRNCKDDQYAFQRLVKTPGPDRRGLALVRTTSRAEVDVIGVQRC